MSLPLCGVGCRPSEYPRWGSGGQEHGGRKGQHNRSAASAGRFPTVHGRSPASEFSHPRDWPW